MNQNIPPDPPGPLCLTAEELQELTGRRRSYAQRRVLNALGIDYRLRPDNSIVVFRASIEQGASRSEGARRGPKFGALSRVS